MVLKSAPLSTPFATELFLIQSQGMERWLSQQLAEHFKVWGNYSYLFPSRFFSSLTFRLQQDLNDAAFDRSNLVWNFEKLLRRIDGDSFKPLKNYLGGENGELKRYQLAQQLAKVFDQYQILRPDLLDNWQLGRNLYNSESEVWQRCLWQSLTEEIGQFHRGQLWLQAIDTLQESPQGKLAGMLPERVSVFGVNSMPPLLLAYLQALSRHCDVHFYLLNPVQTYWADLPGKRLQARLAEFQGHPLLTRLGQQGREFQQVLLQQVEFEFEPSSFEAAEAINNLQRLQNDILANLTPKDRLVADLSISIHACHSRLREVQVLKNQLLATLENDKGVELRDIVVMAPDIQLYAPFINSVFADIQHAIADRSLRISNAALNALLSFLNLAQSRFGWQSVLDLLEQPLVYGSFGLAESDLELIRYWIVTTNVRWGKSATHKESLGLPALNQNTWQASLERLFMGYAVSSDDDFVDGVLPYPDIEGSSSLALGGLNDFLQLLFRAAEELQVDKTLADWQSLLRTYTRQLLNCPAHQDIQALNELLAEITPITHFHQQPVALAVLIAWLEGRMQESMSSNGFLRGQLTFCSMLPMRSIPFKVIALLGMNDGEFPKIDRPPSFDLLSQYHRLGDRSRRADDRYQFLEILLSTRLQLIITYIGQSLQDNSRLPPSVVVCELLEVLRDSYGLNEPVVFHPLHAFSPRNFDEHNPKLFSYSKVDYVTAQRLLKGNADSSAWWRGRLEAETPDAIVIADVLRFYRHPQRYFLTQRLGISLPGIDAETDEREPFVLDALSSYAIQQDWIADILDGKQLTLEMLHARGLWPSGAPGEVEWRHQQPEIQQFVDKIKSKKLGAPLPPLVMDLQSGCYRLVGKLEHNYENGCLLFRYGQLKGKDFLNAWLQHLLMNSLFPQTTYLISKDKDLIFRPELACQQILHRLIDIYLEGRRQPAAFLTEAAFCYLQQKKPETALNAVIKQLQSSLESGYEAEISQLFAGEDLNNIINDEFAGLCQALLVPAWNAVHED